MGCVVYILCSVGDLQSVVGAGDEGGWDGPDEEASVGDAGSDGGDRGEVGREAFLEEEGDWRGGGCSPGDVEGFTGGEDGGGDGCVERVLESRDGGGQEGSCGKDG